MPPCRLLGWPGTSRVAFLRHQRERPDRPAGRHLVLRIAVRETAAETGSDRHVLLAIVGVGDRRRVDRRAGLELPDGLAGVLVEREEVAGQLAGEYEAAAGCEHSRRTGEVGQRDLPLLLTGQRI